ncbi:hypothetical protein P8A18_09050 [Streptomyces castrisilvae]|uniref:DUF732 domain-containing protein n=1 Tax=Streptomyces castrisilvae TaxID=3033811 RepID=A0ABY9HGC7_9ACTN|nr:hypothetical protein [Streptomyces sp. Mut1]WLQ33592.1 hypothetical protein P8A18_09050 [Streptomyces sp. Mut1]
MNTRIAAPLIVVGLLVGLTACGSSDDDKAAAAPGRTVSEADRDAARKAAGLPEEPSAHDRYAFLEALDAIDPRISKADMDERSVSRGLNQCGSIRTTKDRAKLIELTLERFTIATRLPDINNADTGGKILDAVHKHLCPDF